MANDLTVCRAMSDAAGCLVFVRYGWIDGRQESVLCMRIE